MLNLLKIGLPYEVIKELSDREIKIILGFQSGLHQYEADEQERQQRMSQARQNINVGR